MLGFKHPDDLLERLTASQIMEWEAYYLLEPFGEDRADFRMGILASTVTNLVNGMYTPKNKKPKMVAPDVFMPDFIKTDTKPKGEEMETVLIDKLLGFASKHSKGKK